MKDLLLSSKQNLVTVHGKNNRKNKHRDFYKWRLERVIRQIEKPQFEIEYFPSSSENGKIQTLKKEIIEACNKRNIFDFNYTPQEKDYLSINRIKNHNEYLNLIFLGGKWKEEQYVGTLRDYESDVYEVMVDGVVEL